MPNDAPLGSFQEQVMLAVVRTGRAAYGMNVRRELEAVSGRDVAIGAIYATLDRLEAKRLVASRRDVIGGASRRVFLLTRTGARALADSRALRDRLWAGIDVRALVDSTRG